MPTRIFPHDGLAIVHNGIIENHEKLRNELKSLGYTFNSDTDTECIAHLIHHHLKKTPSLFEAVQASVAELNGAYALVVMSEANPGQLILARCGCPVVVGLGDGENFVASDMSALLPVTRRFIFLEEGDVAEIHRSHVRVVDSDGKVTHRAVTESELSADAAEKGQYSHYMLKEIHEQPRAVAQTLEERVANGKLLEAAFGPGATEVFRRTEARAHRRLRDELPRRLCRPLPDRAGRARALPRRYCQRVPLPESGGAEEHAVRHHFTVRRNGRHAGGPAACQGRPATYRRWPSATCRRARWFASRNW